MTNKKKKIGIKTSGELPAGPLKSGLAERNARRHVQRTMLVRFDQLSVAFDEILTQLRVLSEIEGLKIEISHLLEEAQRWIVSGVDRALTEDTSNEIEEARKLLELEHLLLDFAATPAHLEAWTATEPWRRQSKFGFGKLREREERRQGLGEDMVIAARDYWITHSIHSHPKTLKDEAPRITDQGRSLLLLLSDLLGHAISVMHAAKECVESQSITIPLEFTDLSTDAISTFWARMHETLHSHIPEDILNATREPHLKKQVFPYPIKIPNDKDIS